MFYNQYGDKVMNIKKRISENYKMYLKGFYIIVLLLYIAALFVLIMGDEFLSDYDTALCLFNDLINTVVTVQNIILSGVLALLILNEGSL